jgi:hypothetical protein
MMPADDAYATVVERFARAGAEIIGYDPRTRYQQIGRIAKRPLEPGFIPLDARPKVVTVSYYPNETELTSPEFAASRASFERWARDGSRSSYESAYRDWLAVLHHFRFTAIGCARSSTSWISETMNSPGCRW